MHLTRLRPVFESPGPFVSLHLEVGGASEDALSQREARWTTTRRELEDAGIDTALLEDIGRRVLENTHLPGEVRRTIVTDSERVLLDDVQVGHNPRPEVIEHSALPDLSGWLSSEDLAIPFVLAVVDREGADIDAFTAISRPPDESETVTGETFYITKVAPGDWAQKKFQQTAENTWQHNAELVADAIRSLARSHRPRVVLVAGEVRARAEVTRALESSGTEELGRLVQVESGGRAAGASVEALWQEVDTHLREVSAELDADVQARVEEARGRGEAAATGIDEVLEALAKSQVDRLVVDLDAVHDKSITPAQHEGLPVPAAAAADEQPADRVLVAAAALTGAELTLLPSAMARGGGVSALLRWDD
ncbi:baeRF2 domain-containing protein [Nocardioides allogilvus]|uniref:baeRF2 domain-containing protein n=1 Tax=Nocardioides allogilvus TaxID=2072017 RepID=UPI001300A68C|nr:Vms1/Ankzf1 family peptidyl-tRNA hydrolase [Nocardioides allogilvus]